MQPLTSIIPPAATGPGRFTTAQLSRVTGISKPVLAATLKEVTPDGEAIVRGQRARVWSLPTLPIPLQQRLESTARERGYRCAEQLLHREGTAMATPVPAPAPAIPARAAEPLYRELRGRLASFRAPAAPSATELDLLWADLMEFNDAHLPAGKARKKAKRKLLEFLLAEAPFLAKSFHALQEKFRTRLARWQSEGHTPAALADRRKGGSGRAPVAEPTEEDRQWLVVYASKYGGGINQGWREARLAKKFSPAFAAAYAKYHVCPRWIRDLVTPDVERMTVHLHGPHAAKTKGAYINRDPNGIAAGDWDQCDDMTLPVFWYEETPDGIWHGQGQWLVWVDERSWMAYSQALISDRAYNAFSIRNSWTNKAAKHGLPRKGLYLENGIWRRSRVVAGRRNDVGLADTEKGLRGLGLRIEHARHARGKIIERIYGFLQDHIQTLRGYVGRDPFSDKYEAVQKQILRVKAGEHPSNFFFSKAELFELLEEILAKFNSTPMYGKYHAGLSPEQAYQKHFTTPLVHIPEAARWVLASNRIPTRVTANGVKMPFKDFGGTDFIYQSEELGRLIGREIITWFNPEMPDFLAVHDMAEKFLFLAPRAPSVANHDPAPGVLETAQAAVASQNKYHKAQYRALQPKYAEAFEKGRFRKPIVSRKTSDIQEKMDRARAAVAERKRAEQSQENELHRLAAELKIDPATLNPNTQEAIEALRAKKKILESRAARTAHQPSTLGE